VRCSTPVPPLPKPGSGLPGSPVPPGQSILPSFPPEPGEKGGHQPSPKVCPGAAVGGQGDRLSALGREGYSEGEIKVFNSRALGSLVACGKEQECSFLGTGATEPLFLRRPGVSVLDRRPLSPHH